MNILVTGSRGVVGSYLQAELSETNCLVTYLTRFGSPTYEGKTLKSISTISGNEELDLTKFSIAEKVVNIINPDVVINLAAISTPNHANKIEMWKTNTLIPLNLLTILSRLAKSVRFIQASSIVINNYPLNIYAASKLAAESILKSFTQVYEHISGVSLRMPAVVGLGSTHGLLRDVVDKLHKAHYNKEESIELWGNKPGSCKPYMYAGNLAMLIKEFIYNDYENEISVGSSNSISVETVAKLAMESMGIHKEIVWNSSKIAKDDQNRVYTSIDDRVKHYYPWSVTSSEDAVKLALQNIVGECND